MVRPGSVQAGRASGLTLSGGAEDEVGEVFHRQSGPHLNNRPHVAGSLGDRASSALVVIQRSGGGLGTPDERSAERASAHADDIPTLPRLVLTSTWWLPIVAARYIEPILLPRDRDGDPRGPQGARGARL